MPTFASDRDFARVIISDVADDWTLALDFKTGNERRVPTSAPGGLLPLIGDIWLLTKENGIWELLRCIDRNVESHERSMGDVLQALERAGLIRWCPDEADDDDVLSRHGTAFIGELRRFPTSILPAGWTVAAGSTTISIQRQRRLFRKLGTTFGGDGVTTFGVPRVRDDATSDLTFPVGWTAYASRENNVVRSGPMAIVQGIAQNTSAAAIALPATVATIPTGYRPVGNIAATGFSGLTPLRLTCGTTGAVRAEDPTGTFTVAINGWVEFQFQYRIETDSDATHWLICVD